MQNAYLNSVVTSLFAVWLITHVKLGFKNMISKRGYSEKVADELWKWYDISIICLDISKNLLCEAASYYRLIPERDGLTEEEKQLTP